MSSMMMAAIGHCLPTSPEGALSQAFSGNHVQYSGKVAETGEREKGRTEMLTHFRADKGELLDWRHE